ncbi:MAG: hypothetical protein K6B75_00405 [Lachnospiraceae bacterium]|nr:hypothetical protein [Lachnospiraceae bacterium]
MDFVQILFIIIAIVLIVVSCFIGNDDEGSAEGASFVQPKFDEKQMSKKIDKLFSEKTEEAMIRTDDYLAKISNEKIISVQEFTDQILEKIQNNHKEVVYMYDLLNRKDEEVKKTIQELNESEEDLRENISDVIKLTKQLNANVKKAEQRNEIKTEKAEKPVATEKKVSSSEKKTTKSSSKNTVKKEVASTTNANIAKLPGEDNKNKEILELYKQGKSILDISKAMGLGQGEVKLVIDLYS